MTKRQASGVTVRPWVLSLLAVVIAVVWAVNILAGLVVSGWHADSGVNAVMGALLALIGAVGGKSLLSKPGPATGRHRRDPEGADHDD